MSNLTSGSKKPEAGLPGIESCSQSDQVQLITLLMIRVVNDNKYSTSRSRKGSMYFFKPTSRLIRLFRL